MTDSIIWLLDVPGGPRQVRAELGDLPDGWVRVRVAFCGLCGSDMSKYHSRRGPIDGEPIGHEWVGTIVEVGSAVTDLAPGQVVVTDLNFRCGTCDRCRAGRSHLCRDGQVARFGNRGFATFVDIDRSYLVALPGPARAELALSEPLSCVLHALAWARPVADDRVLVVGAGGLGTCLAFALSTEAPGLAFDLVERHPERLATVTAAAQSATAVTGRDGEYDVVFDVSGTDSGLRLALERVAVGGRLCTLSHLEGQDGVDVLRAITRRDVSFTVSYLNGERDTLARAAELLATHWDAAWERTLQVTPLAALPEAFAAHDGREAPKTIVRVGG